MPRTARRPRVTVISDTIQEFDGVRYWRCGAYFQRKGRRLHRVVWSFYRGDIPLGAHIHHVDEDKSNNQFSNLRLLTPTAHLAHHGRKRGSVVSDKARASAAEWHGSAEGLEWHRQQYEKHCRDAVNRRTPKKCEHCGIAYEGIKRSKYHDLACKAAARRASGVDDEDRLCAVCGTTFTINRYRKTRTCRPCWAGRRRAG